MKKTVIYADHLAVEKIYHRVFGNKATKRKIINTLIEDKAVVTLWKRNMGSVVPGHLERCAILSSKVTLNCEH